MTILKVQALKMAYVDIVIFLTLGSPIPTHFRLTFQEYNDSSSHHYFETINDSLFPFISMVTSFLR